MKKPLFHLQDAGLSLPAPKPRQYPIRIIIALALILFTATPIYRVMCSGQSVLRNKPLTRTFN